MKNKKFKVVGSVLAGTIFLLAKPVQASKWLVADGHDIPVGSTVQFVPGQSSATATTQDGRRVVVKFTDYDQWWLQKSDKEQALWLDFWAATSTSLNSISPGITFVKFMKQAMNAGVTLADIGVSDANPEKSSAKPVLPDWAITIAQMRCSNYKAGMSYDEGREHADTSMPANVAEQMQAQLRAGSTDGNPTTIGLILLSVKVQAAVDMVCGDLADKLIKKSAYN
jgi:hypothetical protein